MSIELGLQPRWPGWRNGFLVPELVLRDVSETRSDGAQGRLTQSHCRSWQSLQAGPCSASVLLLPPPGFLLPGTPWVSVLGAVGWRAERAPGRVYKVRASADPVTGDPTGHTRSMACKCPRTLQVCGGTRAGSVGALLYPRVPRAHAGFSRR